jgi:hypothetical protein
VPDKCVVVNFSNQPDKKEVLRKSMYTLRYRDYLLKVDSIQPDNNSSRLYFTQKEWERYERIIASDDSYKTRNMTVTIEKMKDIDGNIINAPNLVEFKQYREFFTQRLNTKQIIDQNARFMRKDRPIFTNQIFDRPNDFSDYWMNTPLKNLKE